MQGIEYEPQFGLLVCSVHGVGIHPTIDAITRHLRGKDHFCKGKVLKAAVALLYQLPLKSQEELHLAQPLVQLQPVPAISSLTVTPGWNCLLCHGEFLTTSRELRDRHIIKAHSRRPREQGEQHRLWESCNLQTFFIKTGERQYFRVKSSSTGPANTRSSSRRNSDSNSSSNKRVI